MKKNSVSLSRLMALTALLYWSAPYAEDMGGPDVEMRGYGTLGAVYHNASGVQYRRDISQGNGVAPGQLSFAQDSMLAVQGTAHLQADFDASVQLISRQDVYGRFVPEVAMAYAKYYDGDTMVRLGRMTIETYMKGDSAEVGYANLLVRPPVIYYPRTFDGLDAENTLPLGEGLVRVKGTAGWTTGKLVNSTTPYDLGGSPGSGASVEYSRSGWTGRMAVFTLKLNREVDALQPGGTFASVLPLMPNGTQIFNALTMKDRRVTDQSIALLYDSGSVQGGAGYSQLLSRNWPTTKTAYAYAGYNLGVLTPYVSYSQERTNRTLIATGIPNGLSAQTDVLNQTVAYAQSLLLINQSDFSLGMRYDFAKNMAFKFQLDRIRYQDPVSLLDASLVNSSVANRGYKSLTLISVALDFLF